jgi:hypothetical protein
MAEEIVWEQVLNEIVDLFPDKDQFYSDLGKELMGALITCASRKIHTMDYSFKKVLELPIFDDELDEIFNDTGYIYCRACLKIVEEDHVCSPLSAA